MADLSDIEQVLVSTITRIVYPTGTANPSIAGAPVKLFRGWPVPGNLDADLKAGTINVSVYPLDTEQKTTRYPREWVPLPVPTPALTLTASDTTITVGGTPSSPLNAAAIVNGSAYVYPVQPGDTTTSIATGLAALIAGGSYTAEPGAPDYTDESSAPYSADATSSGPVITIPGAYRIAVRLGVIGTAIRETKRQKRTFQITFWCPNPTLRDLIAAPVDAALADIDFLGLPDGTAGRLLYERSRVSDRVEREGLYRRDLFYSVEYGTTDSTAAAQIVTTAATLTGGTDPANPALTSINS
jgi:hypothetical protein